MAHAVATRRGPLLLLVAAMLTPFSAAALERNDSMSTWLESSAQERTHVLDELRAENSKLRQADPGKVMACMNGAAGIAGHQDLRVGEVAEACAEPPSPSGDPKTDI